MPTVKKTTADIDGAAKTAAPKKTTRTTKKAKPVEPPVEEELSPEVVEAINVIKTPPPKASLFSPATLPTTLASTPTS